MPPITTPCADPSGTTMPGEATKQTNYYEPGFQGQPYGPGADQLIQTAEDLLARREPKPGPYWPSAPLNDNNDTLRTYKPDSYDLAFVSDRGGKYRGDPTADEIEQFAPGFKRLAVLDAIKEALRFAELFLRDELRDDAEFAFTNMYLQEEIREVVRKHLTRLMSRWYELEATPPMVQEDSEAQDSPPDEPEPETTTTTKKKPTARFWDNEPHLPGLDTGKLILAAEYLLNGQNPPPTVADYFSEWVEQGTFDTGGYENRDFTALLLGCDGIEEDDVNEPENQRKLLEAAIREVLECIRVMPQYRNLNLGSGTLMLYRRELTFLLGKWIEVSA